jgi:hypothetical protein
MRVELLDMVQPWRGRAPRSERLAFLAAFLNDPCIRDCSLNPRMYEGMADAAMAFPSVVVCNLAAMQLARNLEMNIELPRGWEAPAYDDWSWERWKAFRAEVREAVDKQLRQPQTGGSYRTGSSTPSWAIR